MRTHSTANRHSTRATADTGVGRDVVGRRAVLRGTAGVTLAAGLGVVPSLTTATKTTFPVPGRLVVDVEAAEPDVAVVLLAPNVPIDDWWVWPDESVADFNPTYDPKEPVVVVAYLSRLSRRWPSWLTAPGTALFDEACARGIKFYAFPASRLVAA